MPPYMPPILTTDASSSDSSPDIGVIVGAVIGGVVVVFLLLIAVVSLVRRYRRRNNRDTTPQRDRGLRNTSEAGERFHGQRSMSSEGPLLTGQTPWLQPGSDHKDSPYLASSYHSGGNTYHSFPDEDVGELLSHAQPLSNATPFTRQGSVTPPESSTRYLPPLIIPPPLTMSTHSSTNSGAAAKPLDNTSASSTPTSSATDSTESLYSQPSASTHLHNATLDSLLPIPLPPLPSYLQQKMQKTQETKPLDRTDTTVIGQLLKSRAKRDSAPARTNTQTSRIERAGSIVTAPSPEDKRPAVRLEPSRPKRLRPTRTKSSKGPHVPMEPLLEAPDSSTSATFTNPWPVIPSPPPQAPVPSYSASNPIPLTIAFRTSLSSSSSSSLPSSASANSRYPSIVVSTASHTTSTYSARADDGLPDNYSLPAVAPLNIASAKGDRAKLKIETQFDPALRSSGSGADTRASKSQRKAHMRDSNAVRMPQPRVQSRTMSTHAEVGIIEN